jgi:hypothetical protein
MAHLDACDTTQDIMETPRTATITMGVRNALKKRPNGWCPYQNQALSSRSTAGRLKTSHAAGHRKCSAWSWSNSCLRASLPALLAAAMV